MSIPKNNKNLYLTINSRYETIPHDARRVSRAEVSHKTLFLVKQILQNFQKNFPGKFFCKFTKKILTLKDVLLNYHQKIRKGNNQKEKGHDGICFRNRSRIAGRNFFRPCLDNRSRKKIGQPAENA